jgi:DHA1 family tetracycline resistance protein-like MFS transporter
MAAAALTLLNALYGLIVLPESLPESRRAGSFHWRRANPLGSLTLLRSHHELLPLAGVNFLFQLANMVWPSSFVLYTGYRYHWTPAITGFVMMAGSVLGIGVQSFVVGPFVRRFGERAAMAVGAASMAFATGWYAFAPTGFIYLMVMPVSCLNGLLIPGLQGLMTRRVGPMEQGQLQGANQSLMGVASVIGPPLFGLSLAWTVRNPQWHLPGLPMLLASLTMVGCFTLAQWAGRSAARAALPAGE